MITERLGLIPRRVLLRSYKLDNGIIVPANILPTVQLLGGQSHLDLFNLPEVTSWAGRFVLNLTVTVEEYDPPPAGSWLGVMLYDNNQASVVPGTMLQFWPIGEVHALHHAISPEFEPYGPVGSYSVAYWGDQEILTQDHWGLIEAEILVYGLI